MKYLKVSIVISLLAVLTFFFSQCLSGNSSDDPRGQAYAGAKTCVTCHQDIYNSYIHNNHYKTSAETNTTHLKKLIAASAKDHFYFDDSSYIHIEEREKRIAQTYFVDNKEKTTQPFDISFGSAGKAQTYGYWKENMLYQLPLTYFTSLNNWVNSPGFSAKHARFERVITSRCFECHASYVNKEFVKTGPLSVSETLDKNSIVYGIDCERCHGPAASHVKFQQDNPTVKTSKYIISIKSLTRQQRLDLCATCHSGNDLSTQRSLFDFIPGDTLSHFYYPSFGSESREPDVHGKQLQLLQSSLCFQKTDMTCTTCHNSHEPEGSQNKLAAFVSKCMDCHQSSTHATDIIKNNEQQKRDFNLVTTSCIDCHMPLQTSKTIYFNNGAESKNIPYFIRTHKIAIYK